MRRKVLFLNEIRECDFSFEDLSGVDLYSKINPNKKEKRLYISLNYIKSLKEPIKPLGIDVIKRICPFGSYDNSGKSPLVKGVGGTVYLDISDFFRFPVRNKMISFVNDNMNDLIMKDVLKCLKYKNTSKRNYSGKVARNIFKIISIIKKDGKKKEKSKYKPECGFEINLIIEGIIDEIQKEIMDINDSKMIVPYDFNFKSRQECLEEKIEFIRRRIECVKILMPRILPYIVEYIGPYVFCGIDSYKSLIEIMNKYNMDIKIVDEIKNGFDKSINKKMKLRIVELADLIRDKKDIIDILKESPNNAHHLILQKNYSELNDSLERFLSMYGMSGQYELDISNNRYEEDFSYISKLILDYIFNLEKGEMQSKYHESINKSEECEKQILDRFNNKYKIKNYIENIKEFSFAEEYIEYSLMRIFRILRRIIYEGAQLLEEENLIESKDDAAYLEINEIIYAMTNNINIKDIIQERKNKYRLYENVVLPKFINGNREIY